MNPDQIIKSFQVQLIKTEDGIVVARGNSEFLVEGEGAEEAVFIIFSAAGKEGIAQGELYEMFLPDEQAKIEELLGVLIKKRYLSIEGEGLEVPEDQESTPDVFFWNFGFDKKVISLCWTPTRLLL